MFGFLAAKGKVKVKGGLYRNGGTFEHISTNHHKDWLVNFEARLNLRQGTTKKNGT